MKFQPGDRVRTISNKWSRYPKGHEGVIVQGLTNLTSYRVNTVINGQRVQSIWSDDNLELVLPSETEYEYIQLNVRTGDDLEVGDCWFGAGAHPTSEKPRGFVTKKDKRLLWCVDKGIKFETELHTKWDQGLDYYRRVKKSPPPTAEELKAAYEQLKKWAS